MRNRLVLIMSLCVIAILSARAQAIVLTFDSPAGRFLGNNSVARPQLADPTLPLYGDHVSATLMGSPTTPFAYSYGATHGLTPNVGISYGPGSPATPTSASNPFPVFYPHTFGNLTNVMYQLGLSFNAADLKMSITLTADPGYKVTLYGFDLAGYQNYPTVGFVDNLNLLQVIVNGSPNTIGSNIGIASSPSGHNTFDFSASPYTGSTITILLDGTDLSVYGGNLGQAFQFTNIAIDNVAFAQFEIPEPASATLALALLGMGLVGARRRSR